MDEESDHAIKPLKIGVRFKPPAVVLFYEDKYKSLRRRTMPVHQLAKNSIVSIVADGLRQRHIGYLENVPTFKLEKMIRLLQENIKGKSLDDSLETVEKEFSTDPDEDLNKLDDHTLKRKKEIMNESFEKNRKKPGDNDFKYDIRIDFEQDSSNTLAFDSEDETEKKDD